jgi:Type IV secretion-system coupling protein DNA-binding domain
MGWFGGKSKDEAETEKLRSDVRRLIETRHFQADSDVKAWIIDLLVEVCAESDLCLASIIAEPLGDTVWRLLEREAFLYVLTGAEPDSLKDGVKVRDKLRHVIQILSREAHFLAVWRDAIKALLLCIVGALPVNALCDPNPDGSVETLSVLHPVTPLYELMGTLPLVLTQIMGTLCAPDLVEMGLFQAFGYSVDKRLCLASGIAWEDRWRTKRKVQLPIEKVGVSPSDLVTLYLTDTLFQTVFMTMVPIPIPPEIRFEHMHIVGGTGAGKTQLLQYLIMDDLHRALDDTLSLVVIDPDGTLIKTITQTDYFGPYLHADRCIVIDPSEAQFPVALNLFDIPETYGDTRTRESIENNTIELFEYFFDALLGSELTGKQSTLFRYLAILLMHIPNGNIHTLRELMENGAKYKPYMDTLTGSAKVFFETRFFAPDLKATKTQVLSRLWGVLSSRALDRILSSTTNSIDFDTALQSGTMIFVHTSQDYLGAEGSRIFARLIVALLGQALLRRASVKAEDRTPVHIYIDEADGVVDHTLVRLLAQARKYKAAITLAHQHLDQLSSSDRAGVLTNTSIKLVGGISVKDAAVLAPEMRTSTSFLLDQKKSERVSHFALYAKNITPSAMSFRVPLGYAENCERLSQSEYVELIAGSRERCGAVEIEPTQVEARPLDAPVCDEIFPQTAPIFMPEPIYKKVGGGGARHSEIERGIIECAEACGFRASLEETVLDGDGRIDVVLRRADLIIACEVSVTTTREHEYLNVTKCHRFSADKVWVVAASERHRLSLERFIVPKLTDVEKTKTSFLTPEMVVIEIGKLAGDALTEKVVKGWKVSAGGTAVSDRARRVLMEGYLGD